MSDYSPGNRKDESDRKKKWAEVAKPQKVNTIRFNLLEHQKQARSKIDHNSSFLHEGKSWPSCKKYFICWSQDFDGYIHSSVKTHRAVHLRFVHCTVEKLYNILQ